SMLEREKVSSERSFSQFIPRGGVEEPVLSLSKEAAVCWRRPSQDALNRRIKMKRLIVNLHRITLRLPRRQPTLQKLNPRKLQTQRILHDRATRLFTDARAIEH